MERQCSLHSTATGLDKTTYGLNILGRFFYSDILGSMNDNAYAQLSQIDKNHIFDVIDAQPNQLRQNYADSMRDDITAQDGVGIENVLFVGMGGSALAGSLARNWLSSRSQVPIEVVRGDKLPGYTSNRTLAIISSYSGDTAETLGALEQAFKLNAQIIGVGRGGKLARLCRESNLTFLKLPQVSQPRLAVFACLRALACVLDDMNLVNATDLRRELQDAADYLDTAKLSWGSDATQDNLAKRVATSLQNKPVIIYTSPLLESAGYKWKIDINENAKQMAFSNTFTELNHNEMQGWVEQTSAEFANILLHTDYDSTAIKARISITEKLLKKFGYEPIHLEARGSNHIQQLLYIILLGDFVSAYLAILNGVDPTPVELVQEFKKKLELST